MVAAASMNGQGAEVLGVTCLAADLAAASKHVLELVRRGE
jgi:hypothetical protein